MNVPPPASRLGRQVGGRAVRASSASAATRTPIPGEPRREERETGEQQERERDEGEARPDDVEPFVRDEGAALAKPLRARRRRAPMIASSQGTSETKSCETPAVRVDHAQVRPRRDHEVSTTAPRTAASVARAASANVERSTGPSGPSEPTASRRERRTRGCRRRRRAGGSRARSCEPTNAADRAAREQPRRLDAPSPDREGAGRRYDDERDRDPRDLEHAGRSLHRDDALLGLVDDEADRGGEPRHGDAESRTSGDRAPP